MIQRAARADEKLTEAGDLAEQDAEPAVPKNDMISALRRAMGPGLGVIELFPR